MHSRMDATNNHAGRAANGPMRHLTILTSYSKEMEVKATAARAPTLVGKTAGTAGRETKLEGRRLTRRGSEMVAWFAC